jgi:hypothetical protein
MNKRIYNTSMRADQWVSHIIFPSGHQHTYVIKLPAAYLLWPPTWEHAITDIWSFNPRAEFLHWACQWAQAHKHRTSHRDFQEHTQKYMNLPPHPALHHPMIYNPATITSSKKPSTFDSFKPLSIKQHTILNIKILS